MILLKIIALTNKEGVYDTLKKTTPHLTCKKYRSRLSRLTSASFIITQNGKYFLTSFGKVVHNAQMMNVNTLESTRKLNAVYPVRLIVIINFLGIGLTYYQNILGCHYYRCR